MSNAVSKIDNRDMIDTAPRVEAPVNLFAVIARAAADPTVDIEKFRAASGVQDRVEAGQAKKAFNAAVSAARGRNRPDPERQGRRFYIVKGRTNYRYEGFDTVARQVDPVLNEQWPVLSLSVLAGRPAVARDVRPRAPTAQRGNLA